MTLRFKRNYPLVLMLVGILSILALTMGNQPIVSYTLNTDSSLPTQLTVSNFAAGLTGIFNTQATTVDSQVSTLGETSNTVQP